MPEWLIERGIGETRCALIEDGRRHLLLGGPIRLGCPVRLLQGQADPDVPWELSVQLAAAIRSADVQTILVKDGDHRLSRAADIGTLISGIEMLTR